MSKPVPWALAIFCELFLGGGGQGFFRFVDFICRTCDLQHKVALWGMLLIACFYTFA